MYANQPENRGLFLARRGALLVTPERGWLESPEEIVFHADLMPLLRFFSTPPRFLYLVGNEEEVAFEKVSEQACQDVQQHLLAALELEGVHVQRNFICTSHPLAPHFDGKDSVFRMPNVGVFKAAQQQQDLDLENSWLLGERSRQILAAERAGCRRALVLTGIGGRDGEYEVEPELVADDARTALRIIQLEEQRVLR